jgi:hypothetical protein
MHKPPPVYTFSIYNYKFFSQLKTATSTLRLKEGRLDKSNEKDPCALMNSGIHLDTFLKKLA